MRTFSLILIALIKVYQLVISPYLGPHCRFTPSCSHYAIEAFRKHNLFTATIITTKRLLKCHPWHPGGHDPLT